MIVYGDLSLTRSLTHAVGVMAQLVVRVRSEREAGCASELMRDLLIESAALCQAIQDRELERFGYDELTSTCEVALRLVDVVARSVSTSASSADMDAMDAALAEVAALAIQEPLLCRVSEGFAFYAAYPELYALAARTLHPSGDALQVIGIRSIGAALAPVVSMAAGATRPTLNVRPLGHPFARELRIGPQLERRLLDNPSLSYAIVDEGPGLSGSSFCSVIRWLVEHGVSEQRIILFPSHRHPPGSAASDSDKRSYARATKYSFELDTFMDGGARSTVARWFEQATGKQVKSIQDLSGGRWRNHTFDNEHDFPAALLSQERRKLLIDDGEQQWLMRYLGLGIHARALRERAQLLSDAGWVPPILAHVAGFTVGPWLTDAKPAQFERVTRADVIAHVAHYLTFLVQSFQLPAAQAGARPNKLWNASRYNVEQLLGAEAAQALRCFEGTLPELESAWLPIRGDNKLDAHEWLVERSGRVWKADALDHHAGHDFIGAQDLMWDVAGAVVELALDETEREALVGSLAAAGHPKCEAHLAFYLVMYLSFRAAQAQLALGSAGGPNCAEATRLEARRDFLLQHLATQLGSLP